MHYQQKYLDRIWNIIKGKTNLFFGEYTGLKEVKFDLHLDEFIEKNASRHRESVKDMISIVLTDLSKALDVLESVDIRFHHLSCAADVGVGDNSALCIHYLSGLSPHALTIPGVNYVPTKKTLDKLLKIYQE